MRKVVSTILVLIMCLILSACGNSTISSNTETVKSEQKTIEVVGKWTADDGKSKVYISLNKDYSGEMESEGIAFKFTWEYDESTRGVTIDFEAVDLPGKLTYNPKDDTLIFGDGRVLNRVS